jgi:hypothetical protein
MVIRTYTNIPIKVVTFGFIVAQNMFTVLNDRQIYLKYSILGYL